MDGTSNPSGADTALYRPCPKEYNEAQNGGRCGERL